MSDEIANASALPKTYARAGQVTKDGDGKECDQVINHAESSDEVGGPHQ